MPYLATKKSWHLSTPARGSIMLDTFLEEIGLVPAEDVDTTRLGLRLPPAGMAGFRGRLISLLHEYSDRVADLDAPAWSVFIAIHTDPNRPDPAPDPAGS